MKTSKFFSMIGVAAMALALAACSNDETVEQGGKQAISFKAFVNKNIKNARSVTELSSVSNFYVFGNLGADAQNYTDRIFNNELQSTPYYWSPNKSYIFGAYADGEGGKIDNATFDEKQGVLTFADYTVNDGKDLIAAVATTTTDADVTNKQPLGLTFNHMLSQLRFTFTTDEGENSTLKISDLNVSIDQKGTCTYKDGGTPTVTWVNANNKTALAYAEVADVAVTEKKAATESHLVIPQTEPQNIEVTFKATFTTPGYAPIEGTFKTTLAYNTNQGWQAGYRYNYSVKLNAADIDPTIQQKKIEFTPTVESWENAAEGSTTPQKQ